MKEMGVTTWPSADPKKSNFLKPAQFFSVSANSANPEEAVKLIDYWTKQYGCKQHSAGRARCAAV